MQWPLCTLTDEPVELVTPLIAKTADGAFKLMNSADISRLSSSDHLTRTTIDWSSGLPGCFRRTLLAMGDTQVRSHPLALSIQNIPLASLEPYR